MTTINSEQLFGIIPIDEEDAPTISEILVEKKAELDAIETRKPNDYYENQREREDSVDYGS